MHYQNSPGTPDRTTENMDRDDTIAAEHAGWIRATGLIEPAPLRILVVDDEAEFRTLIPRFLEKKGYSCAVAVDASEAMQKICGTTFDLVISDIRMKEKDGLELMREAKRIFPDLDFIIATGFTAEYSHSEIIARGAADFITKPFDLGELQAKIERLERERNLLGSLLTANKSLSSEAALNSVLATLSRKLMASDSIDEIALFVLEEAKRLTGSPLGYVAYSDAETGKTVCPQDEENDFQVPGSAKLRKMLVRAAQKTARQKKPFISNKISEPAASGRPPGAAASLIRLLSVPAIANETLLGQLVLAGSPRDYSFQDLTLIQSLAAIYALATQRAQVGLSLRRTRDYLENIFENSPDAIGIVDARGRLIKWNRMADELLGYTFEDLREKHAFELYSDRHELGRMLARLREEGVVRKYEIGMKRKDGATVMCEISISLLKNSEGKTLGSVCIASDLSPLKKAFAQLMEETAERERMGEALVQSERRFRDILENVHLIAVCLDIHGRITFCNDFFRKMTGRSFEDILGRNWFRTFLPEEQRRSFELIFERAISEGEIPAHYEGEIITPRGERKLVLWNNMVLFDARGKVIGTTCIGQDISEARKAEEELRRTNAEMSQLLASIPTFLIGLSPGGHITRWNKAAETTFGIPGSTAVGATLDGCAIGWDKKKVLEAVSLSREQDTAVRLDSLRFVNAEGREGFLDIIASSMGNGNGPGGGAAAGLGRDQEEDSRKPARAGAKTRIDRAARGGDRPRDKHPLAICRRQYPLSPGSFPGPGRSPGPF